MQGCENYSRFRIPRFYHMNARINSDIVASFGLHAERLPRHVAIIMDGNGRWANRRKLPRALGHRAGVERLQGIIRLASDLGIEALTLYAFSTENWKRPEEEISALCGLFVEFFVKEFDDLHKNGVVIRGLGNVRAFPERVYSLIESAETRTAGNDGLKLNVALNYGSHAELLRAVNLAASSGRTDWDEASFDGLLYTHDLPPVDLLIRTGGDKRLSNFLLYQAAYAELMFIDDCWPDFSDASFAELLCAYEQRARKFGGLGAQT